MKGLFIKVQITSSSGKPSSSITFSSFFCLEKNDKKNAATLNIFFTFLMAYQNEPRIIYSSNSKRAHEEPLRGTNKAPEKSKASVGVSSSTFSSDFTNMQSSSSSYLISLSSCCVRRVLQKFSMVSLATVTLSLVWLLMGSGAAMSPVMAKLFYTGKETDITFYFSFHWTC